MLSAHALRDLVEQGLEELRWPAETGELGTSMRYALEGGGKRIRPVLCLAAAEAAGAAPRAALGAALALELVHSFSLVHDDLPALDDDDVRRGRPTLHRAFGEGVAVLAGDALLVEAFRLALSYEDPAIARELAHAAAAMIGGQYLDITGADDAALLDRLKTGRLFTAAVTMGLEVAGLEEREQVPWRAFADELGQLFQLVDDLLDRDGTVERLGEDATRTLVGESVERAGARLDLIEADTSVIRSIMDSVADRARS